MKIDLFNPVMPAGSQGLVPSPGGPDALAATLRRELDRWDKVVREARIKAD